MPSPNLSNGVIITGKPSPGKSVVFLDIDNTLYPASLKVNELMGEKIYAYFASLGMDKDEATRLNQSYYTSYGLSLRGLTRHHNIGTCLISTTLPSLRVSQQTPTSDPLDFDRKCDGSLPLEDILQPNYRTRKLLQDLDRKKTQVWALTNAYKHHAARVLKILKLDDLVEGIIYCDYANPNFSCKPEPQYYQDALIHAGIRDPSRCYFIDDSLKNVRASKALGWGSSVLYREHAPGAPLRTRKAAREAGQAEGVDATIGSLEELRRVWPHLFRKKRLPFRN